MKIFLDKKLDRDTWKHYILQSFLAAISLFIALNLPFVEAPILIAAIGSTSFIVFAMPYSRTAQPRNVFGGHLACGLLGLLFSTTTGFLPLTAVISLGVGLSILTMVALDIEHPPAGGTVIFLILTPVIGSFIILLLLASIMMLVSLILRPYMKNLL